ncbi:tetratricopeptide repeat protein [Sporolactobacillus vineae]|uniref:tetratricopeptide repeat protein n=1 Tax=Sporolactobacillus vineae TaxID=444463 RepID=UPI00028A3418|nr:tetratricopeptide repeat protein [Sporolactobacillus vineae]
MDKFIEDGIQKALKLVENGQEKAGLQLFEKLSNQYPDQGSVWLSYGLSLDKLAKEDSAIPKYLKALALGLHCEEERTALICLASSYRNTKQYELAMAAIKEALIKYPKDIAVKCFYSLILLDNDQAKQAVKILGQTLINKLDAASFGGFHGALRDKFNHL